jgi:hypothetical protein
MIQGVQTPQGWLEIQANVGAVGWLPSEAGWMTAELDGRPITIERARKIVQAMVDSNKVGTLPKVSSTQPVYMTAAVHQGRLFVAPMGTALDLGSGVWVDAGPLPERIGHLG